MKKIQTFCNGKKPFVFLAFVFILLGIIFNDKLLNLTGQSAQLISITPAPTISNKPTSVQYPSLSNSGFYLIAGQTQLGGASTPDALNDTQLSITKDVKTLISEYYTSGCATVVSTTCTSKLTAVLNSLYTYSTYATAYNKAISVPSTTVIGPTFTESYANVDWAGIAMMSVVNSLKANTSPNVEALLLQIKTRSKAQVVSAISTASYKYTPLLTSEVNTLLTAVLRSRYASFNSQTTPASAWVKRGSIKSWGKVTSSSDGSKLAALDSAGYIYTSTNGGTTWTQRGIAKNWTSITSSSDGSKLAATAWTGHIYTSTDSGATWTQKTTGTTRAWRAITSSSDGMRLAAVVGGGYIYTSTNGGTTWSTSTAAGSLQWNAITSDSTGLKLAAVSVGSSLGTPGYIYTSTDGGISWARRTSHVGRVWNSITSSADGSKLAAVVNNGYIYTSKDGGTTWSTSTSSGVKNWISITSSADGSKLAAAALNSHIYTSVDGGATWTQSTTGIARVWSAVASDSTGTKLVGTEKGGYVYTATISASASPVVTPTSSIQANPYLFVFGANPLGYLEFKALDNASSLSSSLKYLQVNGSIESVDKTISILNSINASMGTDSGLLNYANTSVDLDKFRLTTPGCDSKTQSIIDPVSGAGIYPFEMDSKQEIDVLNIKVGFSASSDRETLRSLPKNYFVDNSELIFSFSDNSDGEGIGSFGGCYLQNNAIRISNSIGAKIVSIKKPLVVVDTIAPFPFETPFLNDFTGGICGILSIAHSLNSTLKIPVPSGWPNPNYYSTKNKKVYWNKNYLEKLVKEANVSDLSGGLDPDDFISLYQSYLKTKNIKRTDFGDMIKSYIPLSPWGMVIHKNIGEVKQKELIDLYNGGKTDCSLLSLRHASHVKKIYNLNDKMIIEINDTLNQGGVDLFDNRYTDAPFSPGSTTFELDKVGEITKISYKGTAPEVSSYWKSKATKFFGLICFTPESTNVSSGSGSGSN